MHLLGILFVAFLSLIVRTCHSETLDHSQTLRTYDVMQLGQTIFQGLHSSQAIQHSFGSFGDFNRESFNFDPTLLRDIFGNNQTKCLQDLWYIVTNINNITDLRDLPNSWSLQMIDAYGKPESGFIQGNLKWLGDFDECRSVYAPKSNISNSGDFHGQYCSLQTTLGSPMMVLQVGLCLPDSCNPDDFNKDIKEFINITKVLPFMHKIDSLLNVTTITCKPNSRKLTSAAIATICILSLFALLAVLGSLVTTFKYLSLPTKYDSLKESSIRINYDKQNDAESDEILIFTEGSRTKLSGFLEKADSFLNCFCIFTNGSKLLNTDASEGQLLCLHGIRFLSMSWVIVCHTYAFSFSSVRNMRDVLDKIDTFPFQVILNGFFSVDSFFVLSAFLMSYLYLQEAAKNKGNLSWLYFYVHRYLRLTPVYMLMIGFYTTLFPYFGSGPLWTDYDIDPVCQKYWWWNLLYINNFLKSTEECVAWSWYLANDMQFFIVSPLFLISLWRWPKVGFSLLSIALCGSWIASYVISYHYNLFSGFGDISSTTAAADFMTKWADYFDILYVKPYTRIGPYLVGIALGYLLFKRKITPIRNSIVTLYIGWAAATAVALSCVYGLYHKQPSLVATSFYNSLSRTGWGLCLSWVIYVCLTQQAVIVDKILSFKLFIPLSRLTYCAYLIHPMFILGYLGSLRTTFDFSHPTMVILFLGLIIVTYAFALLVSLLFESPIIRLEKLIRESFKS